MTLSLKLALQPAFILLGDLHHLGDGVLEGIEVRKRLHVLAQAQAHLERLQLLAELEEHRRFLAARVGPHDELQRPPRPLPEIRPERVLVVTGEAPHHLLEIEAQIVAPLVDRQVLGLRHTPRKAGGLRPPDPPIK